MPHVLFFCLLFIVFQSSCKQNSPSPKESITAFIAKNKLAGLWVDDKENSLLLVSNDGNVREQGVFVQKHCIAPFRIIDDNTIFLKAKEEGWFIEGNNLYYLWYDKY